MEGSEKDMALIRCHECGNEVSTTARTCPKCGAKPKKQTGILTWLFLIFIAGPMLIGVIVAAIGSSNSSSSPPVVKTPERVAQEKARELDGQRESYARIIAEREIRALLKAPRGAKFSGRSETKLGKLKGGSKDEWVVQGYVDAENSFGAMLRSNYQVVIEFEAGKYDSSRTKSAQLLE
jgi:hypothetical protein